MNPAAAGNAMEGLALCYSKLWETELSAPDVFAFLSSHPDVPDTDRLSVLLVDQEERWQRGRALPLRIYLTAFPEIAARGEMVRALVDGERRHRRKSSDRGNETTSQHSADLASEAATHPIDVDSALPETEGDRETWVEGEPATKTSEVPRRDAIATKGPAPVTTTHDPLSFSVDESYLLQSEAESLRAMLNVVRFTLVRRLGAGGMGVVYEAYDQERGELVALKTMKRVNPAALVRFKQEFRALSDMSHPNLVNLYELFAVEDRWFFTMELIEGCNFLSFVRRRPDPVALSLRASREPDLSPQAERLRLKAEEMFDEQRLRDALGQLAAGVAALHQSGKLHRDIKPTNVLVTLEGRVVLLDFGLTAELESQGKVRATGRQVVGTAGHMSPEQALGHSVTPASDWYSVGVILYEAMTGDLPFAGSADEIVVAKQTQTPPPPELLVNGLPEDLIRLCARLLERDPKKRPTGREVIAILTGSAHEMPEVPESNRALPLVGRARHRQVLDRLFASLSQRSSQSLFVFGRTGMGKTTLIRSFLDDLFKKGDAVVLSGRCYLRESVPYKALDSLIDALARHLKGLPSRRAESLLPPDVTYLARVFPVLQSVEAVAGARHQSPEMPDPQELRRRAVAGLRELLARLGAQTPLILAIDDLQWGDVDSAILLSDLLWSPPPPILLFIGCFRSEDADQSPFLREIRKAMTSRPGALRPRELAVEALAGAEARELAVALLGKDDTVSLAQAHMVARESRGNPLFIDELVKHIQSGQPTERWEEIGQLDLDEVLWARTEWQPEDAKRLLGTVAVSGRPIRQALAFQAAELGAGARVALASLRSARLVRSIGQSQQDEIETYHDRIRETVVAHLPPERVRWHHERMALVLATSGPVDAEVLAEHYRGSGDVARAFDYYSRAADQSAAALAFDHAARLYRIALELHSGSASQTGLLNRKLGDALANAGRGAEAVEAYLKAAESATAADTLELKRLASAQLLISGHAEEGLTLLRTLLGPLGLSMPDSARRARLSLWRNRALLRLRGLRFRSRDESEISAVDLSRIDLCWSAVAGLSMIAPVRGADFQARGLLLALRAGEPLRIARALAMEAGHLSTAGVAAGGRVALLLEAAEGVARRIDSPYAGGMIEMIRGIAALMVGRWKAAQLSLDRADQTFRNHCTGVAWERATVQNFVLWALTQLGELAELKRRWTVLFRESQDRGDLYAGTILTTWYMTLLKLAANEAVATEFELEAAASDSQGRGFTLQQSSAFESLVHLYLYRGDVKKAWLRVNEIWPGYSQSMLLRIQAVRIDMLELRARCALAMGERTNLPDPYVRQAAHDARRLEREGVNWAHAHSHYVRAGVAACKEHRQAALAAMNLAAEAYDDAEMPLRAQLIRYRLGEVQNDAESLAVRDGAEKWIERQGIVAPARWAGLYAPGFARIAGGAIETTF
jgi:serine/threonine protein kinase